MSQQERDWLEWLKRTREGILTQRQAAEKMGITDRWVRKLLARLEDEGDRVVVHGLRGRPSNRRIGEEVRSKALALLQQPEWHDFKPKFASEQLAKRHHIQVSKETVRGWMVDAGLWQSRRCQVKGLHPWRPRRSCYGELVQWDTSDHDWLEGRGEKVRYLVRLIDDATNRSWGRFVWHDGTRENMGVLREYLERYGRMVEVYTDRDSMFAVPPRKGESEQQQRAADRLTQIGRALRELGIGAIVAYSPQAKGRVERSFQTDQDRLVKELRLAKVSTMQTANAFLEKEYWPEWNAQFARSLEGITDLHRPLTPAINLAASLSHVETRVIGSGLTFAFAGTPYRIAREDAQAGMKGQPLRVELRLDGTLQACYRGRYLGVRACDERADEATEPQPRPVRLRRKGPNAGGKSHWMQGFWELPAPPIWQAIRESNAHA
jgi:DNA-binding Lrp family transcriptional regulator